MSSACVTAARDPPRYPWQHLRCCDYLLKLLPCRFAWTQTHLVNRLEVSCRGVVSGRGRRSHARRKAFTSGRGSRDKGTGAPTGWTCHGDNIFGCVLKWGDCSPIFTWNSNKGSPKRSCDYSAALTAEVGRAGGHVALQGLAMRRDQRLRTSAMT